MSKDCDALECVASGHFRGVATLHDPSYVIRPYLLFWAKRTDSRDIIRDRSNWLLNPDHRTATGVMIPDVNVSRHLY